MEDKNKDLGIATNDPKFRDFCCESKRKNTLKDILTTQKLEGILVDKLSDAEFFLTGDGDDVRCYHCGIHSNIRELYGDPMIQHARWKPGCSHVLLARGWLFISRVAENPTPHSQLSAVDKTTAIAETPDNLDFPTCVICNSGMADVAFLPCGHLITCYKCAQQATYCSVCRDPVEKFIKTLFR